MSSEQGTSEAVVSPLVRFAERELDLAGVGDPDADYDGALKGAVLEIVKVFSEQGHSGMSAAMVIAMAEKLMRFEPLTPLSGEDSEWNDVGDFGSSHMRWQNNRCSHVFKRHDGLAYDAEGIVFEDADGARFTARGSHVPVTFPYAPRREVVRIADADDPEVDRDRLP